MGAQRSAAYDNIPIMTSIFRIVPLPLIAAFCVFDFGCAGSMAAIDSRPAAPDASQGQSTVAEPAEEDGSSVDEGPPMSAALGGAEAKIAGADPKINEPWSSVNIDPLVGTLESESREVYVHRRRLVELVGVSAGQVVVDVGAGSGFMSLLFAEAVGDTGLVRALDVNATLLARVDKMASDAGLTNIKTVISAQVEAPLDPNSADVVFICDTYHHFESPASTMRSLLTALKPGGQLVLVDFERIVGQSESWKLKHVRAGKAQFRQEILDVGFEWVREEDMVELKENYVLRFRKPT